jgi:TolA-binding protein
MPKFLALFALLFGAGPLWAAAPESPVAPPPPSLSSSSSPPPPPSFNPTGGTAVGGDPNHPEDKGDLPENPDANLPVPQISENAVIREKLETSYQLYHAEDYDACAKSTQNVIDAFPKRKLYWVRYLQALCEEHQNYLEKAIDDYRQVKKDAPHSTYDDAATFRIGLSQEKQGETLAATYTLRDVIESSPRSEYRLQAFIHLGNLYRSEKDWVSAQHLYKDIIRLYPETNWAHDSMLYLAECYAFSERGDKAIRIYEEMQRTTTVPIQYKSQAQLRIGELHLRAKRWQEAINAFRIAERDYGNFPGVRLTADEKIALAQDARLEGHVRYHEARGPKLLLPGMDKDREGKTVDNEGEHENKQ